MQNELRKFIDTNNWSLISTIEPSKEKCILCPTVELPGHKPKVEETFSIKEKNGAWLVRSIVDPYPITHPVTFKLKEKNEFGKIYYAHGWSEVVVETRSHEKELNDLTADEIKNILKVYINRISELSKKDGVEYIGIIKDNLHLEFEHAHSRIITFPIVPDKIKEKMQAFYDYQIKNEKCLYCELIEKEKNGPRSVLENEHFISLVPFSPEFPYHINIYPKDHKASLENLNEIELFSLAEMIKNILIRMKVVVKPFLFFINFQLKPTKEKDFHFHVEIGQKTFHPTLKESYYLNLMKMTPEDYAKILRG